MDRKRARGEGSKYPWEDPGTSKNRRLRKKYDDTLEKVNIAPSTMLKVASETDDDDNPSKFMDEQRDYERLVFMHTPQEDEDEDEDEDYEYTDEEDESDDSGYDDDEEDLECDLEKKRNVRGPTKMKRMWKEYDPNSKIHLKFNRYGQPCGLKTCKLTSFIGCLVRGKEISLAHQNWSKVDKCHKEKLWTTVKGFFTIDESYKTWVLKSASKKWKDFKAVLKGKYFDPDLSRRQNIRNGCGERIPAPQWEWLVNYWTSNSGQLKSEKNKAIRALQLNGRHTTGSRSNAVVLDQMEIKEGREVGRAELFVETHTTKEGQPIDDYSFEKIDEIRRRFEEDPSLAAKDTNDDDLFSTLFPKERSGRRTGLGLLAGGVGSARLSEALVEVQEVKEENKKLWDVVKTLMSNQTKLEQQYDELRSKVLASQTHPPTETSPRVGTVAGHHASPRVGIVAGHHASPRVGIVAGQHLHGRNDDNQGSVSHLHGRNDDNQGSVSHSHRRHGVDPEETRNAMMQSLQKIKREAADHLETSKKPRRFQTPLHKDEIEDIKCGMEVGLASPNSNKVVAFGTIQRTDRKAKAKDGQPLADYIEVLVSIVYKQTTLLPRSYGKIRNLGSATAHCIPWPRQNIICSDISQLQSKFCSSNSQITENRKETQGRKRSTSKSDKAAGKLDNGQIDSQKLTEDKTSRRKACKEKPNEPTPSKIDQSRTNNNIHITTSRC